METKPVSSASVPHQQSFTSSHVVGLHHSMTCDIKVLYLFNLNMKTVPYHTLSNIQAQKSLNSLINVFCIRELQVNKKGVCTAVYLLSATSTNQTVKPGFQMNPKASDVNLNIIS